MEFLSLGTVLCLVSAECYMRRVFQIDEGMMSDLEDDGEYDAVNLGSYLKYLWHRVIFFQN